METRSKTLGLCDEAWTKGMPLKITSDGFPIVMKPSQNCEIRVKGTNDIAYVGLPKTREEVLGFLETIPRLTSADLESAPDSVYTWLLYSKGGSRPQFAASETETMLELGTTHYAIATSVGATGVHGAGEVWKHGTQLTFNFLSGTFMQSWVLPKECPLKTMEVYIKRKLQTEVLPDLFRGKTLTFSDETFVAPRFIRQGLTTDKLETYVRHGFTVCIHDASAKAECKRTKGTCEKPVTLETMRGGAPPTPRRPQRQGSEENLSQFAEAKRMLQFGELARPQPTAPAMVPTSRIEGMGGRKKTKKGKKSRRKTRRRYRGGDDLDPTHVGVRMAEGLLAPPPVLQMFERLKTELRLTDAQVDTMIRAYSEAAEDGVYPEEDEFRKYLIHRFKLNTRS
jgi:hypothetical protein